MKRFFLSLAVLASLTGAFASLNQDLVVAEAEAKQTDKCEGQLCDENSDY